MHVECQNLIVYNAQYTRKKEDIVFKTKYCSSLVHLFCVSNGSYDVFSFGTHIHSKGHEYAPW